MFFLLDHDIDAAVARLLRAAGHKCETASTVGLATADDDQVSVFADDHDAILITHDKEAIRRRKRNTFGRHVWLACNDLDAVEVMKAGLDRILELVVTREAIVLRVSKDDVATYPNQWQ